MQQMDMPSGIALSVQAVPATGGFTFRAPSTEVRQPSMSKGSIFPVLRRSAEERCENDPVGRRETVHIVDTQAVCGCNFFALTCGRK
jgi:hypothetical protein